MICPYCHSKIDNDSVFCPKCGKEINLTCPKCGHKNKPLSFYCNKCGEPLMSKNEINNNNNVEPPKEEKASKPVVVRNNSVGRVFSIIAMSLMILAMLLLVGLSFAPLKSDNFFSPTMFTAIGYAINVFSVEGQPINTASAILVLVILAGIVVTGIIFLAMSIPKFIKAIASGEHCGFFRKVLILFLLYISLFVVFNLFAYSDNNYANNLSGSVIFLLIFVPITLLFAMAVKEINNEEHDAFTIIFRSAVRVSSIVLLLIVLSSIGGIRFDLNATVRFKTTEPDVYQTGTAFLALGNAGAISYFISLLNTIYKPGLGIVIKIFIFDGISVLSEIIVAVFALRLVNRLLVKSIDKATKPVGGIVDSSFIVGFALIATIFNLLSQAAMNELNDVTQYNVSMVSHLNNSLPITCIALGSILLVIQIINAVLETIANNRREQ